MWVVGIQRLIAFYGLVVDQAFWIPERAHFVDISDIRHVVEGAVRFLEGR